MIGNFLRNTNWYRLTPYGIVLVTFLAISNINLSKDYKNGSIEADGKGYYAYLPAVFIYHDLSFTFFQQVERVDYFNPNLYYNYLRISNGKVINKYFAGTALCMLPFFALGHLTTLIAGTPADGYSYYYMLWVHLGALFYLLAGLLSLQKLLQTYEVKEKWIACTLVVITFGTSLFYYTLTEYSMSHVYSFAAINLFLLGVRKYFQRSDKHLLLTAGLLLGIIALIRPVNLVILLSIPFVAGGKQQLIAGIKNLFSQRIFLLAGILCFLALAAFQLIIYRIQTGNFFVYSYPGEGFDILKPHFMEMLFSYRKGLFVYTPVTLMSLAGFVYLWRRNRFAAGTLTLFLLLLTYVLSSWQMWYYGGSFSQRVFVEYYAFFAILLAIAFNQLPKGWMRNGYVTIALVLTLFCQFQTYQYRHMIIHWSDMNREKYWEVFLKLKK